MHDDMVTLWNSKLFWNNRTILSYIPYTIKRRRRDLFHQLFSPFVESIWELKDMCLKESRRRIRLWRINFVYILTTIIQTFCREWHIERDRKLIRWNRLWLANASQIKNIWNVRQTRAIKLKKSHVTIDI